MDIFTVPLFCLSYIVKLNMSIPCSSAILLLDVCMPLGDIYKKFHSSIVLNSKQLKTTHRSMNSGMDKFYYVHTMKHYTALKKVNHIYAHQHE